MKIIFRSSPPEVYLGKGALKIMQQIYREHSCWSTISIKLQSNFIEIALRHGCSPVNFLHIFRTSFPKNASEELLLHFGLNSKGCRLKVVGLYPKPPWFYAKMSSPFISDLTVDLELPAKDTAQKMKFSIKDFFSKCNQIRDFLRIWSHWLKKPVMENFIFLFSEISLKSKYFRYKNFILKKGSERVYLCVIFSNIVLHLRDQNVFRHFTKKKVFH